MSTGIYPIASAELGDIIDDLFRLVRETIAHGPQHPAIGDAAGRLQAQILASGVPLTLLFASGAVIASGEPVATDADRFQRVQALGRALGNLGVHEVTFAEHVTPSDIAGLAHAIARARRGPSKALDEVVLRGVTTRAVPAVGWLDGPPPDQRDPYVASRLAHAVAAADELCASVGREWSLPAAFHVLRCVEQAEDAGGPMATMLMESSDDPNWSGGRRAVSLALLVRRVLSALQIDGEAAHPTVHAALAMGVYGLRTAAPAARLDTAMSASEAVMRAVGRAGACERDHVVRAAALLGSMARASFGGGNVRLEGLLETAYELEAARAADPDPPTRSMGDLVDLAIYHRGDRFVALWVDLIVATMGSVPAGTVVRLADGRMGRALWPAEGYGADAPMVHVDGQVLVPTQPVTIVPMSERKQRASGAWGTVQDS